MRAELTASEQSQLVANEGDAFEVVPGVVSFASIETSPPQGLWQVQKTFGKFLFDSADATWGNQMWTMQLGRTMPNGPALLLLYRRGDTASAFGLISLDDRSWTHVTPLDDLPLYRRSTRGVQRQILVAARFLLWFVGSILLMSIVVGCVVVPAIMFIPVLRVKLQSFILGSADAEKRQEAAAKFMHRIAKDAERYRIL